MFTHGRKCSSFEGLSNRSFSKTRRERVEGGGGEREKREEVGIKFIKNYKNFGDQLDSDTSHMMT